MERVVNSIRVGIDMEMYNKYCFGSRIRMGRVVNSIMGWGKVQGCVISRSMVRGGIVPRIMVREYLCGLVSRIMVREYPQGV